MIRREFSSNLIGELFFKEINDDNGKILSIFDHVFNVKISSNKGFSIVDKKTIMAPHHIQIDTKAYNEIKNEIEKAVELIIKRDYIIIPALNIKINLKKAAVWQGKIAAVDLEKNVIIRNRINLLHKYILNNGSNDGLGNLNKHWPGIFSFKKENFNSAKAENHLLKYAAEILMDFLSSEIKDYNNFYKLLGLGLGLTPSGDDFLLGFISVLYFYKKNNSQIIINLSKYDIAESTTFVSTIALKAALEGSFNESIVKFYQNLTAAKNNFYQAVEELRKIGSTSGSDILTGIIFGFLYILSNK